MLIVETIGRVRREYHRGKSIKEICRSLRLSRNTVRKILRSETTLFAYDRAKNQPLPKLRAWRGELDNLLLLNESKAVRERLTLIRALRGHGYEGGMMQCASMRSVGASATGQ
jgi:hypothetical protein